MLRTTRDFDRLEAEWNRLEIAASSLNPFLSYAWTRACWDTQISDRGALFIVTLWAGGKLVGLAPLSIGTRVGFRVLRFIGEGRSDYLGFLTDAAIPECEERLLASLAVLRKAWDLALLQGQVDAFSGLRSCSVPSRLKRRATEASIAPYTACDGDWATLEKIGPAWISRMGKRLPRFQRDGFAIERFTGVEAASRLSSVGQIERASWKGRQGLARLQPGPGQELLRRAMLAMDRRWVIELWLASTGGEPVAFQINFVLPDRLWIYQQAYDEAHQRASPGSFMAYLAIQRAWCAGAREFDYMSGDDGYKAERTTAARTIRHLAFHPRTVRGQAAYLLLLAPRWHLKHVAYARAIRDAWLRFRAPRARRGPA